jgi:hypothetical protein
MGIKQTHAELAILRFRHYCGSLAVVLCAMSMVGCGHGGGKFIEVRQLDFRTNRVDGLNRYLHDERDASLFPDRVATVPYAFEDVWGGVQGVLKSGKDKIAVCDAKRGIIVTETTRTHSIMLTPLRVKYCFLIQEPSPGLTSISYRFILHRTTRSEGHWVLGKGGLKEDTTGETWEPVVDQPTILYCQQAIEDRLAREISKLPPAEVSK